MAIPLNAFLMAATANTLRANNQYEVLAISGIPQVDAILAAAVMFGNNMTLPNREIEYASVSYKGFECANVVPIKMSMGNEITMNIKCDIAGTYRKAFLAWQNSVMNADISGGSFFEGDRGINPVSSIRVMLLDRTNTVPSEIYKFHNIRIKTVGEVSLTYEGGEVASFDVTFGCTYWEIEMSTSPLLFSQK